MGEKMAAELCGLRASCRCSWRWNYHGMCHRCYERLKSRTCTLSAPVIFFLCLLILYACVGTFFAWLWFTPFSSPNSDVLARGGCQPDNEGSWSIGVFRGINPFLLRPVESANVRADKGAAWPVANPVLTCASVSNGSHLSNFVADPFLFIQGAKLYIFFESKNSVTLKGDIGVAESVDEGATWAFLGVALEEVWHLSYPFVFERGGKIYMMPESSGNGDLRLYRAVDFPLKWTLDHVLIDKPLVDASMVHYHGFIWIFALDSTRFGAVRNGEMEVWYAKTLWGPWKQHKANPIHNRDKSLGARNAGRPIFWDGNLYRFGQNCGQTYGQSIRAFKVITLNQYSYKEVEVPLGSLRSKKGRNAWNGLRSHHIDAQMLTAGDQATGEWIAVVDGDRVPSGDIIHRKVTGIFSFLTLLISNVVLAVIFGIVRCAFPQSVYLVSARSDPTWSRPSFGEKMYKSLLVLNRSTSFLRGRVRPKSLPAALILALGFIISVVSVCVMVRCFFGGNGAEEPYPVHGQFSQFTLLTMTYDTRIWNLKLFIRHYSRCSSVREIVVVWNKGQFPEPLLDFKPPVPVRVRIEKQNSLNNRFRPDPEIKTRAVLELDDDIMVTCDDVERGFKVWRENPEKIVGYYPRLLDGSPLLYRNERYARSRKGYNAILTGAAFVDSESGFQKYWSQENKEGRDLVDKLFNCEDILYNFIVANSTGGAAVEYVHPAWAIDTSKFSSAAISRDTQLHYKKRTNCLRKFSQLYEGVPLKTRSFNNRSDGWAY